MRSIARVVRDLVAVDCVMSKIERKRGLVGPSYGAHAPYSTVDTRARLPVSRGDPLLAESKMISWPCSGMIQRNLKQRDVAKNKKGVETRYP